MPEQTRRSRVKRGQGGQLREDILQATARLLAESTEPAELSLRAVARAVGVATTSIYLHFDAVEELVHVVRKRFFADFGQALDEAAAAATAAQGSPTDRVLARAHRYVDYGLEHGGRYRTMFSAPQVPDHQPYDTEMAGLEAYRSVRTDVAAALDADADAHLIATGLWVALHGMVTLRTVRPDFPWPDLERSVDDLARRLLA